MVPWNVVNAMLTVMWSRYWWLRDNKREAEAYHLEMAIISATKALKS